jgi:hypothetical protein
MKIKSTTPKFTALALLPAAVIAFTSCSSTPQRCSNPQGETTTTTSHQPGVPGGVRVETFKETATVTGIDPATRNVTLVTKDGAKTTVKAGPEVANFAQIEVGDQIKATVTEELMMFVPRPGESTGAGAASVVALVPLGEKPGGLMADTMEFTAKVKSVDLKHHRATLQFPDGTSKTFNVRPDVELTKETVGTDVVIRTTEAIAVSVEKP